MHPYIWAAAVCDDDDDRWQSILLAILFCELPLSSKIGVEKKTDRRSKILKWVNLIPLLSKALANACIPRQRGRWVENYWDKQTTLV